MKSDFRAWFFFVLLLAAPTGLLGTLGLYAGDAESTRITGAHFAQRLEATNDLRQKIELSMYHASDSLRALPEDASFTAIQSELQSTAIPYAAAYISRRMDAFQVVSPAPGGSTADERLRASTTAYLASEDETAKLMRTIMVNIGPDGSMQGMPTSHFTRTDDRVVVFRSFRGLTAGWIFDLESLRHGAEQVLPSNLTLEVSTMPEQLDPPAPSARAAPSAPPGPSFYLTRKPGKVTVGATSEDQTKIVVDRGAKNLVFQVVPKDPLATRHHAYRARVWVVSVAFSCLAFFLCTAVILFRRARNAKKLADLRTDFVAAVSHELRTPLASVRMFAELLEAGDVAEEERAEVEQALAGETRRLNATLDRMLRYGALARGKLVLKKSVQALKPVVEEARQKRDVTIDIDPQLEANIDEGMLGLAIDNLLSNAVKYAPEGGPYTVRARNDRDDLVIDVIDRGPGISRKAQKKVFQPFERADSRLSKAVEGSGVGLALVRGIAKAHGGDATVSSELGAGATFTLRFPRA